MGLNGRIRCAGIGRPGRSKQGRRCRRTLHQVQPVIHLEGALPWGHRGPGLQDGSTVSLTESERSFLIADDRRENDAPFMLQGAPDQLFLLAPNGCLGGCEKGPRGQAADQSARQGSALERADNGHQLLAGRGEGKHTKGSFFLYPNGPAPHSAEHASQVHSVDEARKQFPDSTFSR